MFSESDPEKDLHDGSPDPRPLPDADAALQAREDAARFRALVEASSQMVWCADAGGLVVDMPEWRGYTGQTEEQVRGHGWTEAVHPEDRPRVERTWREAHGARALYECEYRVRGRDGVYRWFAARGVPLLHEDGSLREYIGTWASVDERRCAEEERDESLRRARRRAEQLRLLAEASLVINSTASLGEMFQVICEHARQIIGAHQSVVSVTQGDDWSQAINAVSLSDRYAAWRDYSRVPDGSGIYAAVCRENRPMRFTQAELEAHPAWRGFGPYAAEHPPIHGWLAVPLVARDGANLGLIQLSDKDDGEFTAEDEAILVQLAQLAAVAIENQRLFLREHTRAEREAVLARIGTAIRAALPPAEVQSVAVDALGRALGVDRCYFSTVDVDRDLTAIGRDYRAPDVPSLAGTYRLSSFAVDVGEIFGGGKTVAVADTQAVGDAVAAGLPWSERTAATLAQMRVRALVNVPFHDARGRLIGALGVAMADAPRAWTPDEVAFVEQVATETRSAMDAARLQQRERTISQQLQEALQPSAPAALPGLRLASHYRPALEEAGVGGDFFDVFPVEKGCTALVVADLSGKGLAAAQQVATVRNMLRFALYQGRTVAEAVAGLHRVLVEHDLLTGFATLLVAMYDHARRTLTYVNCGQEPGLVWRAATGAIDRMPPTGPILGGFAADEFEQVTVHLAPGDVVTLFTDGLTEVGPSRKEMLDVEGVSDLLHDCCAGGGSAGADPQAVVDRLIAEVDAFARSGLRDDIALLVGIVGGDPDPMATLKERSS